MIVAAHDQPLPTLRAILRQATEISHGALDERMHAFAIGNDRDYARFLCVQYAARVAMERETVQIEGIEDALPTMSELIAEDLADLGEPLPPAVRFSPAPAAHPLGIAWALAGSAMGNRLILSERRRLGHASADRFLSDKRGALFFRALLPMLESPVGSADAQRAVLGAEAVFETFLAAVDALQMRQAA